MRSNKWPVNPVHCFQQDGFQQLLTGRIIVFWLGNQRKKTQASLGKSSRTTNPMDRSRNAISDLEGFDATTAGWHPHQYFCHRLVLVKDSRLGAAIFSRHATENKWLFRLSEIYVNLPRLIWSTKGTFWTVLWKWHHKHRLLMLN